MPYAFQKANFAKVLLTCNWIDWALVYGVTIADLRIGRNLVGQTTRSVPSWWYSRQCYGRYWELNPVTCCRQAFNNYWCTCVFTSNSCATRWTRTTKRRTCSTCGSECAGDWTLSAWWSSSHSICSSSSCGLWEGCSFSCTTNVKFDENVTWVTHLNLQNCFKLKLFVQFNPEEPISYASISRV